MESTSAFTPAPERRSHWKKYGVVVALLMIGALMLSSIGNESKNAKKIIDMKKNAVVGMETEQMVEQDTQELVDLSDLDVLEDDAFTREVAKLENAGNPQLLADNQEYENLKSDGYACKVWKVKTNKFRNGECIADSGHRVLAAAHASNKLMTVNFCRSMCAGMKYNIAGVQFSSHCFCGNRFTRRIQRVKRCSMRCSGNRKQICGGSWANNVYHTGGALGAFGSKLVGCLKDRVSRVLNKKHFRRGHMTTQLCSRMCKGFRYFGVQFGTQCFCGNHFKGKVVRVKNCNMPCGGDARQVCGGAWANNVYRKF